MALNLAKYRDLLNINKLRQVKEPSADVLLHYGRLQAMRSVSDTVFEEFGEKGADVFGEKGVQVPRENRIAFVPGSICPGHKAQSIFTYVPARHPYRR